MITALEQCVALCPGPTSAGMGRVARGCALSGKGRRDLCEPVVSEQSSGGEGRSLVEVQGRDSLGEGTAGQGWASTGGLELGECADGAPGRRDGGARLCRALWATTQSLL